MALILVTGATSEPVSLAEVKIHLNITDTASDDLLNSLITVSRLEAENYMKRQLLPATWKRTIRDFPSNSTASIELPRPPISTVSTNVTITYLNSTVSGSSSTSINSSDIKVDFEQEPGRVFPRVNNTWPTDALDEPSAVSVQYVSGYTSASAVPEPIKLWIKQRVGSKFEYREEMTTDRIELLDRRFTDGLLDGYVIEDFTRYE